MDDVNALYRRCNANGCMGSVNETRVYTVQSCSRLPTLYFPFHTGSAFSPALSLSVNDVQVGARGSPVTLAYIRNMAQGGLPKSSASP